MSLCSECQDETNRWLDYRKPLHRGVVIQVIGEGKLTIPSHVRTHETLVSQVNLIKESCAKHHGLDLTEQVAA